MERVPDCPTPRRLYVHDDLTTELAAGYGATSEASVLGVALLDAVRRGGPHVSILTLEEQLGALVSRNRHEPFEVAIGIGAAGERVARQVHHRSGWFPHIIRIDLAREELPGGGYEVVSIDGRPADVLRPYTDSARTIAIVDDTVFSGLTIRTVVRALSPEARVRTRAFCLRAVGESIAALASLVPVTAALAAEGRIDSDVSFINASGLVRRGSIRRRGSSPMAFFERPEWIRAWFPASAGEVLDLCRLLNRHLEA